MNPLRCFAGLVGAAAVGLAAVAADKPAPKPKADPPAKASPATTQEILFASSEGPMRVKLFISVDKKPVDDVWRAAVDDLFDFCDRDGNGVLSAAERAAFTTTGRNNGFIVVDMMGYQVPQILNTKFKEDGPGTVSRQAFIATLLGNNTGPVSVEFRPAKPESQQLTTALMRYLDADRDGKLSADELKAARTRLAPLDTNEDEWLTSREVTEKPVAQGYEYAQPSMFANVRTAPVAPKDFLVLKGADTGGVKQFLTARDKDKDGSLSATELGVSAKLFAQLDADGNKAVDADEIAAWLRSPADIELRADLREVAEGTPGSGQVLQAARKATRTDKMKRDQPGSFAVSNRDAKLIVSANAQAAATARSTWQFVGENLKTVFKILSEGKDELDRQKLQGPNVQSMLPIFDFFDRNEDKKLTLAEIDAAVLALGKVVNCRAAVVVTDEGRGLFEAFDRNRDGRLSLRELADLPNLVTTLDKDKDGKLAPTEFPRSIPFQVEQRSIDVMANSNNGFAIPFGYDGTESYAAAANDKAPEWFQKMDRNGDGEISAKEFLGAPALFKQLDANGDGLVDPKEAAAKKK